MIQPFVDAYIAAKDTIIAGYMVDPPASYDEIFTDVVKTIAASGPIDSPYDRNTTYIPDPDRIVVVDHGDYQGTMLFVVGAKGYQPHVYWAGRVSYGSCSGCDTFQSIAINTLVDDSGIRSCSRQDALEYWTLGLHMVQSLDEF